MQATLLSCKDVTAAIAHLVPANQFWRWKDMWCNSLRSAVFSATLVEYLRSGTLLTLPQVSDILGSTYDTTSSVTQAAEYYL